MEYPCNREAYKGMISSVKLRPTSTPFGIFITPVKSLKLI